jgi:hypothetical protein
VLLAIRLLLSAQPVVTWTVIRSKLLLLASSSAQLRSASQALYSSTSSATGNINASQSSVILENAHKLPGVMAPEVSLAPLIFFACTHVIHLLHNLHRDGKDPRKLP